MAVTKAEDVIVNELASSAAGSFGKLSGVFAHYFVLTVIAGNFYRKVFINIKSKGLLGNIL